MNTGFNNTTSALYIRTKRKIKWYKKFWNFITGHKDRNWEWSLLSPTSEVIK